MILFRYFLLTAILTYDIIKVKLRSNIIENHEEINGGKNGETHWNSKKCLDSLSVG